MPESLEYSLRPATDADVPFIFDLRIRTMKTYFENTSGWHESEQRAYAAAHIQHARIIVAAGAAAGVIKVVPRPAELDLHQFQLLPQYQNRGVGASIIGQVQARARALGLPVTLDVLKGNPARRLYERLGFQIMETEQHRHIMRWDPS